MVRELVGSITSLWQYLVKSILEELGASEVIAHRLLGDRAYALLDTTIRSG